MSAKANSSHSKKPEIPLKLQLLKRAVDAGDVAGVKELLKRKTRMNVTIGGEVLWDAVLKNQIEIALALVEAGADLSITNPYDKSRSTLLHELVKGSKDQRCHQLAITMIRHGANVNAWDDNDLTPLTCAIRTKSSVDKIRELLQHYNYSRPHDIIEASEHPDAAKIVAMLINMGRYVGMFVKGERIRNAFHYFIFNEPDEEKTLPAIKVLLNLNLSDVQIDAIREKLVYAIYKKKIKMIQLTINHGFDVNKPLQNGITLLCVAAGLNESDITKLLIQAGAQVNSYPSERHFFGIKYYPIHEACRKRSVENIQVLLRYGANIQVVNGNGQTPFSLIEFNGEISAAHEIMIKHLAFSIFHGKSINNSDMKIIQNNQIMLNYYNQCLIELEKMKLTQIGNKISFFSIFEKNINLIAFLTRSSNFLTTCDESLRRKEFLIYNEEMVFVLEKAKTRKNLLSDKEKAICDSLQNIVHDLPLEKIIFYFYLNDANYTICS